MTPKRILLPESSNPARKGKGRTPRKSRSSSRSGATRRSPVLPFSVTDRQRSEAIGLVLIGTSAFCLSLLHYLSSSRISAAVNWLMVQIGFGVYIIPVLVFLMGVQRFCERPFVNLGLRVAGSAGVLVCGLSFLGVEGGALGGMAHAGMVSWFGLIPARILLFFLTLSSLIFALDILYKDLLTGAILVLQLSIRVLWILWELCLYFLSLLLDAWKTTVTASALVIGRLLDVWREHSLSSEDSDSRLLTFQPAGAPGVLEPSAVAEIADAGTPLPSSASFLDTAKNAIGAIASPTHWRDELSGTTQGTTQGATATSGNGQPASVAASTMSGNDQPASVAATATSGNGQPASVATPVAEIQATASRQFFAPTHDSDLHSAATPAATTHRGDPHLGHDLANTEEAEIVTSDGKIPPPETDAQANRSGADTAANQSTNDTDMADAANNANATVDTDCDNQETETTDEEELEILVEFEDDATDNTDNTDNTDDTADTADTGGPSAHEADQTGDQGEEDPFYLDDNPIDREIRGGSLEDPRTSTPPREVLLPPLELLQVPPVRDRSESKADLAERSALLLKTLDDFGIKASISDVVEGPAVSRFELKPAPGVKVSRITALTDDIALALAAQAIRVEAPIPGKSALGIEIPNTKPTPVFFYDLIKNDKFRACPSGVLNLALGVTINGQPVFADLADMPHLLIAGSTGSGKSVCVNTIIASILFQARSDQVKFLMVDPKKVELSGYNDIPHLIAPVVTDPAQASSALLWAVQEMDRRYALLAECGVRHISSYNRELLRLREELGEDLEFLPFMVILIDELADLMMTASAEVESSICRLAQMARAVGIHLVIATQRPSVNVLTGLIKANLPSRIAFSVASVTDSRTILDTKGAERLLGKGDMLFVPKGRNKPLRLQGAFISDRELLDITRWAKDQAEPEYLDIAPLNDGNETGDDDNDDGDDLGTGRESSGDKRLLSDIIKYLETQEKTSTSMLQRKFRIGYNRAARIMDLLEEQGIVGPQDGSNKRFVTGRRSNTQV